MRNPPVRGNTHCRLPTVSAQTLLPPDPALLLRLAGFSAVPMAAPAARSQPYPPLLAKPAAAVVEEVGGVEGVAVEVEEVVVAEALQLARSQKWNRPRGWCPAARSRPLLPNVCVIHCA